MEDEKVIAEEVVEGANEIKEVPTEWFNVIAFFAYVAAMVFVGMGFHKMFAYEKGGIYTKPVNHYVGGDAYNYIINSNYATAYFVLAVGCVILGSTFLICSHLKKKDEQNEPKSN